MGSRRRLSPEEELAKKLKEAEKERNRKHYEILNRFGDAFQERLKQRRIRMEEEEQAKAEANAQGDGE